LDRELAIFELVALFKQHIKTPLLAAQATAYASALEAQCYTAEYMLSALWDPRISTNRLQTGYNSLVVYYNAV
jgi:hypothetical protein